MQLHRRKSFVLEVFFGSCTTFLVTVLVSLPSLNTLPSCCFNTPGVSEKYRRLINNRLKAFCLIYKICLVKIKHDLT